MDSTQAGGSSIPGQATSGLAARAQLPALRRLVLYTLTETDARTANGQREQALWRRGNHCSAGDVFPMLITRVWDAVPRPGSLVNGQVYLDGNDTLWVASVQVGDGMGHYSWGINA